MARLSDPYRTTYHRDGTITVWDVYTQSWCRRLPAGRVPTQILATLSDRERARIARMAVRS